MNSKEYKFWRRDEEKRTLIMGVLNVTPDSFSDGGEFIDPSRALSHALKMIEEGADIIDIGGESTRPGADPVSQKKELRRVLPVIEQLRLETDCLISIDTTKAKVAEESLEVGADIINDISALSMDESMGSLAASANIPVILMHIKGTPKTMQSDPHYENLMENILDYFEDRVAHALALGIQEENLILDPGIGFGKRLEDNFEIIRELKQISAMGYPVLLGPSRKAFIGNTLNLPPEDRLEGTAAAVTAGIMNGAQIVRVHDVKAMKRVALIADKIKGENL